jgi:hypothetical protein
MKHWVKVKEITDPDQPFFQGSDPGVYGLPPGWYPKSACQRGFNVLWCCASYVDMWIQVDVSELPPEYGECGL